MSKAVYNFDYNLLKLSSSENLEIAKTEWREICREQKKDKSVLCICQNKIKNVIYMYNIHTKYIISVGISCCRKNKFKILKLENIFLQNIMKNIIDKSDDSNINSVVEYANYMQNQLLTYIRTFYQNDTNIEKLQQIQEDVYVLINEYDLQYLCEIDSEIKEKITYEEKIALEKMEKELHLMEIEDIVANKIRQIEKDKMEREKKRLERIRQIEKQRQEQIEFEQRMANERMKRKLLGQNNIESN